MQRRTLEKKKKITMRRNKRKWPTAVVASAAMLLTVLAFVGGGRGALAAGESDYTAPSSYTLESLGRGHHLVWEGVNFEVSGKPSRSERENHSSSTSTSASTRCILVCKETVSLYYE